MALNYHNAIAELLKAVPEFAEYSGYKYIVEAGSGDLPDIVYGVLSNFFEDLSKDESQSPALSKASAFLEEMATSKDKELVSLLAVGFLENFNPEKEYYPALRNTFGEATKKLLDEMMQMP